MTISSTARTAGPFTGDGVSTNFPFLFKVFLSTDILVESLVVATGAVSTLALTSAYTVALNASQDSNPGGTVTLLTALAVGTTLIVTSDIADLQPTEYLNQGGFYPEVLTASLDRLTILVQQLAVTLGLCLQAPLVDGSATVTLPAAAERAGQLLGFDSNGNATLIGVAAGGTVPGSQTAVGVVNAINQTFTFTASGASTPVPLVYAGGIFQSPTIDYGVPTLVSGSTWQIIFTVAPDEAPVTILQLT